MGSAFKRLVSGKYFWVSNISTLSLDTPRCKMAGGVEYTCYEMNKIDSICQRARVSDVMK